VGKQDYSEDVDQCWWDFSAALQEAIY